MSLRTPLPNELLTIEDQKNFDKAVVELQVRTWFASIKRISGLSTNEIARRFPSKSRMTSESGEAESGYLPSQSGYWDQIRRGEHLPLLRRHGKELVDRIEISFPGTRRWIVAPLWQLLSTRRLELEKIYSVIRELPPVIANEILIRSEIGSVFVRTPTFPKELFRRLDLATRPCFPHDDEDTFGRIVGGAIAALALIREAELLQNQTQHVLGRKAWLKMVERFNCFPELEVFVFEFQRLGRLRFGGAVYSPDGVSALRLNL